MTNRVTYIIEEEGGQLFRIKMVQYDAGEWQQISRTSVTVVERELYRSEKMFVWGVLLVGLVLWVLFFIST